MFNNSHRVSHNVNGFTLIELVMVLVLLGIVSVAILPRFVNQKTFDARGFFDQSISMVRYAQKTAIAQRTLVFVNVDALAGEICLLYISDSSCGSAAALAATVLNPADQKGFRKSAPSGVSFSASLLVSFDALGKPTPNNRMTIGVTGDSSTSTITIESDTGYVH